MTTEQEQYERDKATLARVKELGRRVLAMPKDQHTLYLTFAVSVKALEEFQDHHSPEDAPNAQLDLLCEEWITATNRILDYCHVATHGPHA